MDTSQGQPSSAVIDSKETPATAFLFNHPSGLSSNTLRLVSVKSSAENEVSTLTQVYVSEEDFQRMLLHGSYVVNKQPETTKTSSETSSTPSQNPLEPTVKSTGSMEGHCCSGDVPADRTNMILKEVMRCESELLSLHKPVTMYKCTKCNFHSHETKSLLRHFARKHVHKLKCPSCSTCQKSLSEMETHLREQHQSSIVVKAKTSTLTGEKSHPSVCLFCRTTCSNMTALREHIREKHLVCMVCNISFPSKQTFDYHLKKHKDGDIIFYACLYCRQEFQNFYELVRHNKKFHLYDGSDSMFQSVIKLDTSMSSRTLYKCPYCSAACGNMHRLRRHLSYHEAATCKDCTSVFIYSPLRFASYKAEYCWDCEAALVPQRMDEATQAINFSPHVQQMTTTPTANIQLKPSENNTKVIRHRLPCLFCPKTFAICTTLRAHLRQIHRMCNYCFSTFKSVDSYSFHEVMHKLKMIEFYICKTCHYVLQDEFEFSCHNAEHHQNYASCRVVDKLQNTIPVDQKVRDILCPYCSVFISFLTLPEHLMAYHCIVQCTLCDNLVRKCDLLCATCQGKMEEENQDSSNDEPLTCDSSPPIEKRVDSKPSDPVQALKEQIYGKGGRGSRLFRKTTSSATQSTPEASPLKDTIYITIGDNQEIGSLSGPLSSLEAVSGLPEVAGHNLTPLAIQDATVEAQPTSTVEASLPSVPITFVTKGPRVLPCLYCNNVFHCGNLLSRHLDDKHWICRACQMNFSASFERLKHVRQMHLFPCTICSDQFTTMAQLQSHCSSKHAIACLSARRKFRATRGFPERLANNTQCPYCHEVVSDLREMDTHLYGAHRLKMCPMMCGQYIADGECAQNKCQCNDIVIFN